MTYVLVHNPTDGPVLLDSAGRMLGGHEWGAADTTDDMAAAALDSGRLIRPAAPAKDANPDALAAAQLAADLNARASAFQAADKDDLLEQARDLGLVGVDDVPHKDQLVAALTRSAAPLPAKGTPPAQKKEQ
jgi:hypothetical protein